MSENVSLEEFHNTLACHDWWYNFSDDGRVWRNGEKATARNRELSKLSSQHEKLYGLWVTWYSSTFTEDKLPKPTLKDV